MLWVQILLYVAVVVFVLATVLRIKKYATTPIHLRWELYPVSHEAEKKKYGGSYFEEVEWWKKPNKKKLRKQTIRKRKANKIILADQPPAWLITNRPVFSYKFFYNQCQ